MRALHLLTQSLLWSGALIALIVVSDLAADGWAPIAVFAAAGMASFAVSRAFPATRSVVRHPRCFLQTTRWAPSHPFVQGGAAIMEPEGSGAVAVQRHDDQSLQQPFLEGGGPLEPQAFEVSAMLWTGASVKQSTLGELHPS